MSPTALANEPAILVDQSKKPLQGRPTQLRRSRNTGRRKSSGYSSTAGSILGHGSELAKPGDFLTRKRCRARHPVCTGRQRRAARALLNTCPPSRYAGLPGEKGQRENRSSASITDGYSVLTASSAASRTPKSYNDDFKTLETSNMTPVARFDSYRDFYFRFIRSEYNFALRLSLPGRKNTST